MVDDIISVKIQSILETLKQELEPEHIVHDEAAKLFVLEFRANHLSFFQDVAKTIGLYIRRCIVSLEGREATNVAVLVNYSTTPFHLILTAKDVKTRGAAIRTKLEELIEVVNLDPKVEEVV